MRLLCARRKHLQLPHHRLQLHVHDTATAPPFLWPEIACHAYAALALHPDYLHSRAMHIVWTAMRCRSMLEKQS